MACSIAPFGELRRGKKMIVKTQMIMFSATFLRIDYLISQTGPSSLSPPPPALLYSGGNSSALIWLVVLRHFIWRHKSINAPWATRAHAQTQHRPGTEGVSAGRGVSAGQHMYMRVTDRFGHGPDSTAAKEDLRLAAATSRAELRAF